MAGASCSPPNSYGDLALRLRSFDGGAVKNKILDPSLPGVMKTSIMYAAMERAVDDTQPMTREQAATLKRLTQATYELDAFKPNLTRAEADLRIATLAAKLKLLDGPPHTL